MKTKKTGVWSLYLLFMCTLVLFGCIYKEPQYSEEAELDEGELGTVIMEEWMQKFYPEGEVKEARPYIFYYPSGPSYLTEYVEGVMYDGERERKFAVNTWTEDVFLEADEDMQEIFMTCARDLFLTSLDLPLDTEITGFDTFFDAYTGYIIESPLGTNEHDYMYTLVCLPGEFVAEKGDVESYVNDPSRNGVICVNGTIDAEDKMRIGTYSPEDLVDRQKRFRISYDWSIFDKLSSTGEDDGD